MRFLLSILLIAVISAVMEYFFPWWTIAIAAFVIALLMKLRPGKAFLTGFLGIALLWSIWALCLDIPNDHLLAGRLGKVFNLPNAGVFIAVTAIVGGLVGGMAAWSGALLVKRN